MNTLLIALGSHGDVHPFVGLGQALRDRGHGATVMANGMFEPLVTRAGLGFLPCGTADEYRVIATNPDLWHPSKGFRMIAQFGMLDNIRPVYDAVAAFYESHPPGETVVVGSTLAFGARMAQEKFGVPLATVHLSPVAFQSTEEMPRLMGAITPNWAPKFVRRGFYALINTLLIHPIVGKPMNAIRAEMGLPPVADVFGTWVHSPQLVVAMYPDWFAAPQADLPPNTRLTGFPLYDEREQSPMPPALVRFLDEREPPVAFTPGSAMWQGRAFLDAAAEACRLTGRRGVLLTRHRDHLPPALPPGVIHVDYAPFSQLLPRCAALVHHGGIGTSAQALAAGVPQVVMPMAHDQPDNAYRLKRLGVARSIAPKQFKGPRVAAELTALLGDRAVRPNCRAAADRFRGADAIGDTCDLIERLARAGQPVRAAVAGSSA